MGQRDIRRLLITGAMSVIRWALRRGASVNPWLTRMLERKPPMVGDLEHARTEADEILRHHPDFTVGKWAQTQLYGDTDGVQRDVDALLRVGLLASVLFFGAGGETG